MIITAESWQAATAQTLTGANLAALHHWCAAVSNAILRAIRPFHPEPITVTDWIADAPPTRDLILPIRPVRSITSVYLNHLANGLVANFTSAHLLDNTDAKEYQLLIDDPVKGWSRSGILRRVWQAWGVGFVTYPGRLAASLEPSRGAIKISYAAGAVSVPPEITAAAVMAVSMLYNRKETGLVAASESWNGYSRSLSGPGLEAGILDNPDIQNLLADYLPHLRIGKA